MAGNAEVLLHEHTPGTIHCNPKLCSKRRRAHSCGPQRHRRRNCLFTNANQAGLHARHHRPGADLDAKFSQLVFGLARQILRISSEHTWPAFQQDHATARRLNGAEVVHQCVASNASNRAREFHASWPAANYNKIQRLRRLTFQCSTLRNFIRQQHATADFECVFNRLQPGGVRLPFVVAEIRMGRASGHNEEIVADAEFAHVHLVRSQIEANCLAQQHVHIFVAVQDAADRRCNFARRQHCAGHLVQQRLKRVVVLAINDGDAQPASCRIARAVKAGKACPNHDQMRNAGFCAI